MIVCESTKEQVIIRPLDDPEGFGIDIREFALEAEPMFLTNNGYDTIPSRGIQ